MFAFLLQEAFATISALEFRDAGGFISIRFDLENHLAGKLQDSWRLALQASDFIVEQRVNLGLVSRLPERGVGAVDDVTEASWQGHFARRHSWHWW